MTKAEVLKNEMDVKSQVWIDDFHQKNLRLSELYKEATDIDIYIEIFKDVETERQLLISKSHLDKPKTVMAKNYIDIEKYIDENDTVFVYSQEFYRSHTSKYIDIKSIRGFVVDIDTLRCKHLNKIVRLINKAPLKPNIIVSSGNGLHLYYLFTDSFQFYSFTYCISRLSYELGQPIKRPQTFEIIKQIHHKICNWFESEESEYIVDVPHLSQPLRMCGAKTKNNQLRTKGYLVSDLRLSLEEIAELTGVTLVEDEVIKLIKALENNDKSKPDDYYSEKQIDIIPKNTSFVTNTNNVCNFMQSYKQNPDAFRERWKALIDKTTDICRYFGGKFTNTATRSTNKKRKTNYNLYEETVNRIRNGVKVGFRQKLLHVIACRASMYQIPSERVQKDINYLAEYFTSLDPQNPITKSEIKSAMRGLIEPKKYTNAKILQVFGIDLTFENQEIIRRKINKNNKEAKEAKIIEIAELIFKKNPKTSLRLFHHILHNTYNIEIGLSTITNNRPEIKSIINKHLSPIA